MGLDDVAAVLALLVLVSALVADEVHRRRQARRTSRSRSGNGVRSDAHDVYGAPAAVSHALRQVSSR